MKTVIEDKSGSRIIVQHIAGEPTIAIEMHGVSYFSFLDNETLQQLINALAALQKEKE